MTRGNQWVEGFKVCPRCDTKKDETAYYRCGNGMFMSWCKACCKRLRPQNSEYFKKYYQRNKEKRSIQSRLRLYDVTLEWIESTFNFQKGRCAICKDVIDRNLTDSWHVDHDHTLGNARGILCKSCNHLLGNAKDNTLILESAVAYLNREII